MDKNVKVCPKCSNINAEDAQSCRVCGEPLDAQPIYSTQPQQAPPEPQYNAGPQPQYGGNTYTQQTAPGNNQPSGELYLYGVPTSEVAMFVGEKANVYLPRFIKKALKNTKAGFNWPVFLFGLLISPIVSSFWFFNRKMNKLGALLLSISMVFMIANAVVAYPAMQSYGEAVGIMMSAVKEYAQDDDNSLESYDDFFQFSLGGLQDYLSEEDYQKYQDNIMKFSALITIGTVIQLISLGVTIVFSIFADYWYMKFCISKLQRIRSNPDYTAAQIICNGGTKKGIWISLMILYIMFSISSFVVSFVMAFNQIMM